MVTDVGGMVALVGEGALVVPPGNAAALGGAVRHLLDCPGDAAALGRRAAAVAQDWPDETDTVAQVAAVYAELLG